jgi:hypothetical protein
MRRAIVQASFRHNTCLETIIRFMSFQVIALRDPSAIPRTSALMTHDESPIDDNWLTRWVFARQSYAQVILNRGITDIARRNWHGLIIDSNTIAKGKWPWNLSDSPSISGILFQFSDRKSLKPCLTSSFPCKFAVIAKHLPEAIRLSLDILGVLQTELSGDWRRTRYISRAARSCNIHFITKYAIFLKFGRLPSQLRG